MQFRTQIDVPRSAYAISYAQRGISFGSCFSETIGNRLAEYKFPILVNPFGTIYNPYSIKTNVELLLGKRSLQENDVFSLNDIWQSFLLHTSFSSVQKESVFQSVQSQLDLYKNKFVSVDYVLITLGTAWVYQYKDTGEIVCNCHKVPANKFVRRRLSVEECVSVLEETVALLREQHPDLHVIFTVSPIRHWKDGAHQNQISKSTLLLAIDELQNRCDGIDYFPAYELLLDDLRDYRFYADDMLHPSAQAVEYIWEQFQNTYLSQETGTLLKKVQAIKQAVAHRPFNPESREYRLFVEKTINDCDELSANFAIDLQEEVQKLRAKLS